MPYVAPPTSARPAAESWSWPYIPMHMLAYLLKLSRGIDPVAHCAGNLMKLLAFCAVIASLPLAMAARQDDRKPDKGQEILDKQCTTCHDRRPIDTQALDEAGWTNVIEAEIKKGAKV